MMLKIFLLIFIIIITSYIIVFGWQIPHQSGIEMFTNTPSATPSGTPSGTAPITIYENCNYTGRSFSFTNEGNYMLKNTSLAYIPFRSIRIRPGYTVHVYEKDANAVDKGFSITLTHDQACLPEDFYNIMTSIKIEVNAAPGARTAPPIITFKECNYNGIGDLYSLGQHDKKNTIKSMLIPAGFRVLLYKNSENQTKQLINIYQTNQTCLPIDIYPLITSLTVERDGDTHSAKYDALSPSTDTYQDPELFMIDLDSKMRSQGDYLGSDLIKNYVYTSDFFQQRPQSDNRDLLSMYEQSIQMVLQSHMYNDKKTIDDPISDAYLPYTSNLYLSHYKTPEQANNEYIIMSVIKSVLNRSPTSSELIRYSEQIENNELDEHLLKIQLMNSTEYRKNIKLQSNDVAIDLEYAYAKEDMISYVSKLYFDERSIEVPRVMLLPLRDLYVYLQNNEYLFRAVLTHSNYSLFEKEVSETRLLTKSSLAEIFNRYFLLYDIKVIANTIKRNDVLKRGNKSGSVGSMYSHSGLQPNSLDNACKNQDTSAIYLKINTDADNVFDLHNIAICATPTTPASASFTPAPAPASMAPAPASFAPAPAPFAPAPASMTPAPAPFAPAPASFAPAPASMTPTPASFAPAPASFAPAPASMTPAPASFAPAPAPT